MVLRTFIRQSYVTTHDPVAQALISLKYTAFSLCLDCTQLQTITSVADVAHVLMKQTEVNDFIAKGIDPVWLWPTVTLALYLLRYADCAVFEADCARTRSSSSDRGSLFLDVWEHFVYPVLKAPEHNEWAEKWRGGHITNYV